MIYELTPRYSSRKSFYGKAKVQEYDLDEVKLIELISYSTKVAYIKQYENSKKYVYLGHYSMTTTSHHKEFFKQNGLNDEEIKKLFKEGELEYEF